MTTMNFKVLSRKVKSNRIVEFDGEDWILFHDDFDEVWMINIQTKDEYFLLKAEENIKYCAIYDSNLYLYYENNIVDILKIKKNSCKFSFDKIKSVLLDENTAAAVPADVFENYCFIREYYDDLKYQFSDKDWLIFTSGEKLVLVKDCDIKKEMYFNAPICCVGNSEGVYVVATKQSGYIFTEFYLIPKE